MNKKHFALFSLFMLLTLPSSHAISILGHDVGFDDVGVTTTGAIGGAVAVAGGAVLMGATAPVWLIVGGAVVVAAGAEWTYQKIKGEASAGGTTGAINENVSNDEFINNSKIKYRLLEGYRLYSEEAAAADLVEIKDTVRSYITDYSTERDGQLSQVNITVYGANKVYGFSAYPLQIKFRQCITGYKNSSYVQIDEINVYMVDEDGRKWEGKTYTNAVRLDKNDDTDAPEEITIEMVLKTPDPYIGKAQSLVSGTFNREDCDELLNAEVKKFELFVDVEGSARLYKLETSYDDETYEKIEKEEYDKTEYIDTSLHTFDLYDGIQNGAYEVSGCSATLQTDFIHYTTPIAYHSWANGAVSNMVMRVWASPCHAYNSTALYQYMALGVPENLEPVEVELADDYQAAILRLSSDNSASIAGTPSTGSWDNIPRDRGRLTQLSLTYGKLENTIAFENYFLIVAGVSDGISTVPVWSIVKPDIAVCENILISLSTDQKEEIIGLLDDGEVSTTDKIRLDELADIAGSSTQNKLDALEIKETKYSTNDKAETAYKNALKDYEKALEYLDKIKDEDDPEKIKVYFYLANDLYEPAGDYWSQAAEKYYYDLDTQGDALAKNAEALEELAAEYEPSIWYNAGSTFKAIFDQIKTGLGFGNVDDSVLLICGFLAVILIVLLVIKLT